MARYSEAEAYSYYVVRHKETGQYLRCSHGNDWGDYYNGATIYRQKKRAENAAKVAEMQGNPTEVVEIQIFENPDVVPRVEFAREIFDDLYEYVNEFASGYLDDNSFLQKIYELREKYTEEQS